MASSNRRKKQNRAKAAAKHAQARRRRAATARIRVVQARLGRLWRVGHPVPAPGLRCIDIVSGIERYAESPSR